MSSQHPRRISNTGDPDWDYLKNADSYKIYYDGRRMWSPFTFRYTVARPGGGVLTVCSTLWGARRAVRREIAKLTKEPRARDWWSRPLVDEIPAD